MASPSLGAARGPVLNAFDGSSLYQVPQSTKRPEPVNPQGLKMLQYPGDVPKYYVNIAMSKYDRSVASAASLSVTDNIVLPFPQQLQDSHGVLYEEENISTVLGTLIGTAQQVSEGNISDALGNLGAGALAVGSQLLGGAGTAGKGALGAAPNDFLTVILKGPMYKKYQFGWRFSPRNKEEASNLRQIIMTLNRNAAVIPGGPYWVFPSIFQVTLNPGTGAKLIRYKPAMVEAVVSNITPNGFWSPTVDGYPESIELQLAFHEIEFWVKDDFNV